MNFLTKLLGVIKALKTAVAFVMPVLRWKRNGHSHQIRIHSCTINECTLMASSNTNEYGEPSAFWFKLDFSNPKTNCFQL